jgi:GAF domain-containing protein
MRSNAHLHNLSEPIKSHPLLKAVGDKKTPIHIEDTKSAPSWKGMEFIGKTNVWLGLPIASGENLDGILSLSRTTNTPFSKNEIDMAKTFSEFLSIAIHRIAENYEEDHYVNMIKRKFIS